MFSLHAPPAGKPVATLQKAEGGWAKGWGVIPWPALPAGQGLWLPDVAAVHTVFVRFPLDLLFLDRDLRLVRYVPAVKPGRLLVSAGGARHTLELGAGTLRQAGITPAPGEQWILKETTQKREAPHD
jgi:hypothetical protein